MRVNCIRCSWKTKPATWIVNTLSKILYLTQYGETKVWFYLHELILVFIIRTLRLLLYLIFYPTRSFWHRPGSPRRGRAVRDVHQRNEHGLQSAQRQTGARAGVLGPAAQAWHTDAQRCEHIFRFLRCFILEWNSEMGMDTCCRIPLSVVSNYYW